MKARHVDAQVESLIYPARSTCQARTGIITGEKGITHFCSRKKIRRGRPAHREARREVVSDRELAHRGEVIVATHNVLTVVVDGKHGVRRSEEVLGKYREVGLDIVGLQETCHDSYSLCKQVGYVVYCSGRCGDKGVGEQCQDAVGLAARETPTRAFVRPPKFINERSLKVTMTVCCRASAVMGLAA